MGLLDKILKAGDGKRLKAIESVVEPINALEPTYEAMSDDELRGRTAAFRQELDNGATLDDIMFDAYATVREAAKRTIGQRPYDVQMMGGAALHWGWVAEMKTGEGKTLCSALPVYLNGVGGQGVHVVTVNDYLARRDKEWMEQIHGWLGLTMGLVVPEGRVDGEHKRAQYAADITYGTNNEFGFDYLRDNMAKRPGDRTQRGHSFAIVDEIDSILIDEARTPLIISGKLRGAAELYYRFADVAKELVRDRHYDVDEEKRIVAITDDGISAVEEILGVENLYDGVKGDLIHQLNVALRAKELFTRDKDYLVNGDDVNIVDEFTGRVLEGRRWSDGLHQAVEAKEGVKIKDEQQTLATVTLQNYFRMYDKLAGMTGTALSDAVELENTYGLAVVQVPTNRPIQRMDQPDLVYKSESGKVGAVIEDILGRRERAQPVLVGTASVEKSEQISRALADAHIPHKVLNAKQHTSEAEVVAQAGQPGAVTVATNMAGRGVDIILGGNAEKLAERDTRAEGLDPEDGEEGTGYFQARLAHWEPICAAEGDKVREAGGLYVLATERHESRRIDDQLRGRAGRQGDPGESRFFLSLEDDLMRIFATGAMSWVMDRAMPDDIPIESKAVTKSVERAQTTVEQRNAETRKNVLKYDEVLNEQRKVIYARRQQIMADGDLRTDTMDAIDTVSRLLVDTHCVEKLDDTWDLDALYTEWGQHWKPGVERDELDGHRDREGLVELIAEDGRSRYAEREAELGESVLRQVERQILLELIDQRWREHLTEMDSLRDGINLRAMGQRDPLNEWQREGFELFGAMMAALDADYVKYVMHAHVTVEQAPVAAPTVEADTAEKATPAKATAPSPTRAASPDAATAAPAGQVRVGDAASKAGLVAPVAEATTASKESTAPEPREAVGKPSTVVNDEWANTGRNEPCPCGSGRKFKQCHGR